MLSLNLWVIGLDDFSTGKRGNLDDVRANVGESRWERFAFVAGDIRDASSCAAVCEGSDQKPPSAVVALVSE